MVHFLLKRPIAVIMAFLACLIVGLVTYFSLPVSLLPGIAIPHITVQIQGDDTGARELENNVTATVRRQLLQVGGLNEIKSLTRDGLSIIQLEFDYGVNTDLAFIEVNEKIDAAMNTLPRETRRPKAIKASATDIPVLYINMTLRSDRPYGSTDETRFLQMCELADNVVRRRIEQLPEIAMADVTGIPGQYLRIVPDETKMKLAGVTVEDIENALTTNNIEPGTMTVRDGYYEYNVHISNQLRTVSDVEKIYVSKNGRMQQLRDLCKVEVTADSENGYSYFGGKRAVTLAIIKQSEENMDDMKESLSQTADYFSKLYPDIEFSQSRNQTELLDYTISNLVQNLILGFILVFMVTAFFMGDMRASIIIGASIVVAIIITFLLFYLFHVSLNIISLSGLILAVGMMIDNSVIVTENITQYRQKGLTLMRACDKGTSEMITPMLSSSLTTVAVFVPLVFMSGIAGAIFTDQAFSITAGLAVSYIVGIMLLPVIYMLVYRRKASRKNGHSGVTTRAAHEGKTATRVNAWLDRVYTRVIDWCFAHVAICVTAICLIIPMCVAMFLVLPVERMPKIDQNELIARIEWNENINIDENAARVNSLLDKIGLDNDVDMHSAYIGVQDYLLDAGSKLTPSESEVYLRTLRPSLVAPLQTRIDSTIRSEYPKAMVTFSPPENIFEKIFSSDEPTVQARIFPADRARATETESLLSLDDDISSATGIPSSGIALHNRISLVIDREKLQLYNVDYSTVERELRTALKGNTVTTLRSYQQYLPIGITAPERSVDEILATTIVKSLPDKGGMTSEIPLSYLVKSHRDRELKEINAGKNGEFVPLNYYDIPDPERTMSRIRSTVDRSDMWDVEFTGSFFSNAKMMREMMVILGISILLMYFILCAQFESFVQPLIVLLEIPLDVAFALLTLWIFGHTLNLMSAIGIIVTCGIVVNDSILKLDAINELRKSGTPLLEAIHTAGLRRLRPIIMTSLTTIFAMVPTLFTSDMGSELQQPLAIAMIGSMVVGTLISIFLIPLVYWLIYRNKDKKTITA
ncbi:MAG: efflux RND transporter permease subunit [Paramuribaculum sp.]|nr:efflux RND transporter permease subunit [Paramuribaculum sp.]